MYPGGPNGLSQYPAQPAPTPTRVEWVTAMWLRTLITTAKDLLAATPLAHLDEAQRYVRVTHRGVANGFFEPSQLNHGWESFHDAFGQSVTACDFNGDGFWILRSVRCTERIQAHHPFVTPQFDQHIPRTSVWLS